MKLREYEMSGRAIYAGLAEVVASILTAAIAQVPSLHPQQIQFRAKAFDSLRRKLQKTQCDNECEIDTEIKDLAGARVIFYTNEDVARFQASRLLVDNFEVNWARTKFHHPTSEDPEASELFVSNNYVVKLKPERAALPEYASYAGLWCEVQVQTTLNHAWAEMAHDTIYKKPDLSGFGSNLMKGIEARMKGIMRDYLAPAGYAFQKVLSDFERLSRGQALFEQDLASAVEQASDNNELHETLKTFSTAVVPYFDNLEPASESILAAAVRAVKRARSLPLSAIETPFGNLDGKTAKDVALAAAEIIKRLRFIHVDQTFDLICELYSGADRPEERDCWVKLAGELSEHNLEVWKQAGPIVQSVLVERIQELSKEEKLTLKPAILAVLKRSLSSEISGATSNFDSITIHQGAVAPSDALVQMRKRAIRLLFEFDDCAEGEHERAELIDVFKTAMALPSPRRRMSPELAAIVYEDSAEIIRHYVTKIDRWSYEQRQSVEHDLLWKYRHHGGAPADQPDEATEQARAAMVAAIIAFRDRVNQDEGFTTYKLLVGFQSVFPRAWDDPEFGYLEEEAYRKAQIGPLVEGVSEGNAADWLKTLRRCAATESNDLATFPTFAYFLEILAAQKPRIVLGYLAQLESRLANFLQPMLRGLSRTEAWNDTTELLRDWLSRGHFLSDIAWSFGSVEELDLPMLESIVDVAIAAEDYLAVLSCIRSIACRDNEATARQLKAPFLKAVAYLAARDDPRWVDYWRTPRDTGALIDVLTKRETIKVLSSLVPYARITHNLDWFLSDVANKHPQLVIDYFGERIRRHFASGYGRDYEDIPYDLHRLNESLKGSADLLVRAARVWFEEQPDLFSYQGGKLIEVVFPTFSPALEQELEAYVGTADVNDKKFVTEVLRAYSGEPFVHPLCRAIVAALPSGDPLLTAVEIALEPSGVTTGEFGRVNRLKAHRESILAWADDEREPVRVFAENYAHQLENSIRAEQRRSEESVAIRQLEWDRREASDDSREPEKPPAPSPAA